MPGGLRCGPAIAMGRVQSRKRRSKTKFAVSSRSPFLSSHHKRRRFGSFALLQKKQYRSATTRQSTMSWTASLPLVGDHRGKAPRLIQSANPKGKIGLVATRDLQRFIGDVEGEDLFLFSRQDGHHTDPFSLSLTTVSAKDEIFKNRSWTDARQSITLG